LHTNAVAKEALVADDDSITVDTHRQVIVEACGYCILSRPAEEHKTSIRDVRVANRGVVFRRWHYLEPTTPLALKSLDLLVNDPAFERILRSCARHQQERLPKHIGDRAFQTATFR
jgi:hypothetical protein